MEDKALIQHVVFFSREKEMQALLYQKSKLPWIYRHKFFQFKNTKECYMVGHMFDCISST